MFLNQISTVRLTFLFLATVLFAHADISVTAQFQPAQIALGDQAQYIVAITETSSTEQPSPERMTSLPIPQSGGLTLRNGRVSTSQRSTIVNFKAEHSVTQNLIIEATAPRIGNFTIPAYDFTYKGQTYTAPAATLRVVERPADAPPPVNEMIFLKVDAPQQLYIGQTANIQLKLYLHEQVRYRGYENFDRSADGFTISELPEASESIERQGEHRYQVLTWPLSITPIQTGDQDLNFEFSIVAQIPEQRSARDPFGRNSPFGNSVFDNFFSRSERFNLYTEPTQIEVLPLPQDGKPSNFSGAIGDFSIQVATDAENARVGEPIMLSLKVAGQGNFDRISGPALAESKDWRSYKPESSMEPTGANSMQGVKRFDYVFIPQAAGKRMLPEVTFSYFDPEDKEYVELSAPPIAVTVAPSLQPQMSATPTPAKVSEQATPTTNLNKTLTPEEALLTLDYRPEPGRPIGFTAIKEPLFYIANATALCALIGTALFLRKSRRLRTDSAYAQSKAVNQELKQALAALKDAESQQNVADFYHHAQTAIRLAASKRFAENLRAAELTQLQATFKQPPLNDAVIEATRQIFNKADALRFSGQAPQSDLRAARQQLDTILKAL